MRMQEGKGNQGKPNTAGASGQVAQRQEARDGKEHASRLKEQDQFILTAGGHQPQFLSAGVAQAGAFK